MGYLKFAVEFINNEGGYDLAYSVSSRSKLYQESREHYAKSSKHILLYAQV